MAPAGSDSEPRPYDVTLLGASGFTGAWIAVALARSLGAGYTICLAGRDRAKLERVLAQVHDEVPASKTSCISVATADAHDPSSLLQLTRASKVVISAAGPFRFLGEPVVLACIQGGAHYVDITGEPEFMERMELEHGTAAAQAGVLLVNSCGFDSIPADVGCLFARQTFASAGALLTSVESFVSMSGGPSGLAVHYATYESAVHGFGSADELRGIRKAFAQAHPDTARLPLFGRPLRKRDGLFFEPRTGAYAFPFMGADASVVRRTMRTGVELGRLQARPDAADASSAGYSVVPPLPFAYSAYMTLPSKWVAGMFLAYGAVFRALARFSLGRRLLLACPGLFTHGLFSHAGPSRQQIAEARFAMTFFAQGYAAESVPVVLAAGQVASGPSGSGRVSGGIDVPKPNVHAVLRIAGPEPGYDATSRIVAAATLTLLRDEAKILDAAAGGCGPGVRTPGAAFEGTSILENLRAQGISCDVLQAPHTA